MIGYRFLTLAEIEMTEASAFYEAATSGLGSDFLDEIQRVIHLLRQHPELGRSIDHGFRQAPLYRFPFSLIYTLEVDAILIIAIAHQRRRPGYWRDRK
jgi:plasmid stabilization system protein ParE